MSGKVGILKGSEIGLTSGSKVGLAVASAESVGGAMAPMFVNSLEASDALGEIVRQLQITNFHLALLTDNAGQKIDG